LEQKCKNKENNEKEDNTIANVAESGKDLINTRLVLDASSEKFMLA
jgi:hypothetical protein